MKVLVTGGAGFIGSHIVDRLIELNHDVSVVDNLSTGKKENLNEKAKFYECNITNYETLKLIFDIEKPEVVIHNAAQISVQESLKHPNLDASSNILGTINILECSRNSNVRKIIYPSSAAVYGNPEYLPIDENHTINPISFYGISKYTPEHYIRIYSQLYGIKHTIFRYANVYGMRQDAKGEGGVVSIFIDKVLNGETPFIFGDGSQTRDFVFVKDVAEANILALTRGDNETINISTNTPVTVNGLYETIKEVSRIFIEPIYKEERNGDIRHSYLNNFKAKEILGWENAYSLSQGLQDTIYFYMNLYNVKEGIGVKHFDWYLHVDKNYVTP